MTKTAVALKDVEVDVSVGPVACSPADVAARSADMIAPITSGSEAVAVFLTESLCRFPTRSLCGWRVGPSGAGYPGRGGDVCAGSSRITGPWERPCHDKSVRRPRAAEDSRPGAFLPGRVRGDGHGRAGDSFTARGAVLPVDDQDRRDLDGLAVINDKVRVTVGRIRVAVVCPVRLRPGVVDAENSVFCAKPNTVDAFARAR